MSEHITKVLDVYTFPAKYDEMGGYIFDANNQMIGEVRGWGKLQYLPDAEELQDALGQFIVDAINEKWEKLNEKKVL
jgi:hypothetical protein